MSDVTRYYVKGVIFNDLDDVIRIYKARGLDRAAVLDLFSGQEARRFVIENFDDFAPMSVRGAFGFENAEQRMAALACFTPEEIAGELDAVLLNRQTLVKKSRRWDNGSGERIVEYEDTYELFSFPIPIPGNGNPILYMVKCSCPSTGRVYYLYVPAEIGLQRDAITAVAWTMRFNGRPLTASEYIKFMYSET